MGPRHCSHILSVLRVQKRRARSDNTMAFSCPRPAAESPDVSSELVLAVASRSASSPGFHCIAAASCSHDPRLDTIPGDLQGYLAHKKLPPPPRTTI